VFRVEAVFLFAKAMRDALVMEHVAATTADGRAQGTTAELACHQIHQRAHAVSLAQHAVDT
jgi:hypothetical protein